jgi:CHAT domain-containing protein
LVDRYQTAANAIRLLESTERRTRLDSNQPQYSTEDFRNQATQARQALQDCLTEIRQIPGYESFLALPTFADIAATLQPGQPLIYLIPTPNGSLALTVSLPSPVWGNTEEHSPVPQTAAIWINDFTATDLLALLVNDTQTGWFDAYDNQTQNRDAWFAILDRTLHKLWQPLLAPLLHHLSQAKSPKATLIPTGLFSLLPLHAAWTPDANGNRRYACDFIQFTYAPNALALPAAREIATQTPATKLLAVNDPQPISAIPLPNTSTETANAIGTFPGSGNWQVLQHEAATPSAVLTALPSYPVAHFSCHGSANFQQPLDSGLLMAHDEILTLRDLLDLKLKGLRLAVLSACETGIPGTNLPDEVISLPTGLLQAGAAGVVSSLWSVADLSTMVLLSRFYQFWRTDGLEPPEALHQAQLWLRDSTGPELASLSASLPSRVGELDCSKRPTSAPSPIPFTGPPSPTSACRQARARSSVPYCLAVQAQRLASDNCSELVTEYIELKPESISGELVDFVVLFPTVSNSPGGPWRSCCNIPPRMLMSKRMGPVPPRMAKPRCLWRHPPAPLWLATSAPAPQKWTPWWQPWATTRWRR